MRKHKKTQKQTNTTNITKAKGGLRPAHQPSISFLVLKLIYYL